MWNAYKQLICSLLFALCCLLIAYNLESATNSDKKELIDRLSKQNNLSAVQAILSFTRDQRSYHPAIIEALSRITDTAAVDFLRNDAIFFPDSAVRLVAVQALASQDVLQSNIAHLAKALNDPDVTIRLAVIQAFNQISDTAIIPFLITGLRDESFPQVRESAVFGLIKFLEPVRPKVVTGSYPALAGLGEPDVLEALLEQFDNESTLTVQWTIEELLITRSLSGANYCEVIPQGVEHSDDKILEYFAVTGLKHQHKSVQALSARILARSNARQYLEQIKQSLVDETSYEAKESKKWAIAHLSGVPVGLVAVGTKRSRLGGTTLSRPQAGHDTVPKRRTVTSDDVGLPLLLQNRLGDNKSNALKQNGGDDRTEQAVTRGLDWLVRNQEEDGSWNCARHNPFHGNLTLPGFTSDEDELVDPSVTGLALLSFIASGNTHQYGSYIPEVERGMRYLLECQDAGGVVNIHKDHIHTARCLRSGVDHGHLARRYNHNIGTLALVELYAMTKDPALKPYVQRALNHSREYILPDYPWSFYLEPSDIGPSVFYIMALRIAGDVDLVVSPDEIKRTQGYLKALTDVNTGRIWHICDVPVCFGGYDSAATGIVARLVMRSVSPTGINSVPIADDMVMVNDIQQKAVAFLKGHPPVWRPMYQIPPDIKDVMTLPYDIHNEWYWYYATLGLMGVGGPEWPEWNKAIKELLLKHQRMGGDLDGSWDPDGPWAIVGGRVYSTTFAIMTLQAYYSYDLATTEKHR